MTGQLTVVLPNYNYGKYVQHAIRAVLNQSHPPDHLIIIDDASTDDSVEKIQEVIHGLPNITFIKQRENKGFFGTVKPAIEDLTTDYFYIASSDDCVMPGFFEKSLKLFEKAPAIGLVSSQPLIVNSSSGERSLLEDLKIPSLDKKESIYSPKKLVSVIGKTDFWLPSSNCIYRTAACREFGGFRAAFGLYSDWVTNCLIGFKYGVGYINEPLAIIRVHGLSYSCKASKNKKNLISLYVEILKELKKHPNELNLIKKSGALATLGLSIKRFLLTRPLYWSYVPYCAKRQFNLKIRSLKAFCKTSFLSKKPFFLSC